MTYNRKRYYTPNNNDSAMRMTQELFDLRKQVAELTTEVERLNAELKEARGE
jgi:uncharacterized protein YlxW (UPF0749 family)